MALATTCPQCKTSFKVIPDQLKLRRGLVRCGVCQHVFSGIDYLRYVDDSGKARQKAPADGSGPLGPAGSATASRPRQAGGERLPSSPASRLAPATQQPDGADDPAAPQTIIGGDDELKTAFFLSDSTFGPYSQTRPQDVVPPRSIVSRIDNEQANATVDPGGRARDQDRGAGSVLRRGPLDREGPAEGSRRHRARTSLLGGDDEDPDVVAANLLARQAREAYRGGAGGRRSAGAQAPSRGHGYGDSLGPHESFGGYFAEPRRRYAVIALVMLAALQLTLLFRSEVASRMPVLRPVVGVLAGAFGMGVDAVRSLDSLSIESFELQATGRDDHLSLNAVLRNKDGHAVRWPAMELTLTDQANAVVVRKVILPSDYLNRNTSRQGLNARSEWPIRISLDPDGPQLAGYSVALFYP